MNHMSRRPSEMTLKIIEMASAAPFIAEDMLDRLVSGGYTYNFHRSKRNAIAFYKRSRARRKELNVEIDRLREMSRLHNTLARLTKDGIIARKKPGRGSALSITAKGMKKYEEWREWLTRNAKPPEKIDAPTRYEKKKSPTSIIVSFDIPEKESGKRTWLRSALKNLDFKMLHKSTWLGTNSLPKELIGEIHRLKMSTYVKIFSVIKHGTIEP